MSKAIPSTISVKKLLLSVAMSVSALLLLGTAVIWYSNQTLASAESEKQRLQDATLAFKNVSYHVVQIQQFLTDASVVGSEDFSEAKEQQTNAHKELARLGEIAPEFKQATAAADIKVDELYQTGETMAKLYVQQGREAGNAVMKGAGNGFDARAEALDADMEKLARQLDEKSKEAGQKQADLLQKVFWISILGAAFTIILFVLSGLYLYRKLIAILGNEPAYAMQVAHDVANGHLDRAIDNRSSNPQSLLRSMQGMLSALSGHMRSIDVESRQIAQSSYQIAEISTRITRASRAQENHSDEVRQATRELAETSASVLSLSQAVSSRASESKERAEHGVQAIRSNIEEMSRAMDEVRHAETQIHALGQASQQIQAITETISGITEQTNLLALNAAIEAARAGEAGRGFAVVADEVRSLAQRAAQATSNINTIIGNLTQLVSSNTEAMSGIIQRTTASMEKAEGANTVFSLIMQDIDNNFELATRISGVSANQMDNLALLEKRLNLLLDTLSGNAAEVHTTGVISSDLYQVTERLRSIMQHFHFDSIVVPVASDNENRRAPRVMQNLMVRVNDGQSEQFAITADFSMTGMRLRLPIALQSRKNDQLNLQIRIPHDDKNTYDQQAPLDLTARIQWLGEEEGHFTYGVAFERTDAIQRQRLEHCFEYYNQLPNYAKA